MKYILYFIAFLLVQILLAFAGIHLPEWISNLWLFWFISYFAVMVAGMATDNWDVRHPKAWTEKQMLKWAFWIAMVILYLSVMPPLFSAFLVVLALLVGVVRLARSLK